ncbi:unnamed protein product, partial [Meganyctiphanes norvegica]
YFKLYKDRDYTYDEGKALCDNNQGLMLAEPSNPLQLRDVLLNRYGDQEYGILLGGHGDGSNIVLPNRRLALSSDRPLWRPNEPKGVHSNACLGMAVVESDLRDYPNSTYYVNRCQKNRYILCQTKTV